MIGDFFNWYFNSLAEFWGMAIRIGLPQILLVVLLICWLRRRGCGRSGGKSCCWIWSCGRDDDGWSCGAPECVCPRGCCRKAGQAEAEEDESDDA